MKFFLYNLKFVLVQKCKQLFFIFMCACFYLFCNTSNAQEYYWAKASNFPDTEAGIEPVTDLQVADGVIRYNAQWYAYEEDFAFKRVETLVNNDETQPGNFYWTGPQGKWIFEDKKNVYYPNVYTLDTDTKEVKTFCNTFNYMYYGNIDKNNIVLFKNQYYTLGGANIDGYDTRIFRRYNPVSCAWDRIVLPSEPRFESYMNKLFSDGQNLYITNSDHNLGDVRCYVTQDAVTWQLLPFPAAVLNNPWYYPKQEVIADKRGLIIFKKMENDQVTGESLTRFFTLKDQVFTPLAMGGDQPTGYWDRFKFFDSGNLYAVPGNKKEILKSTDEGKSWTKIVTINETPTINDFIETSDGNIYIGTSSGVYILKKFKDTAPQGCSDLAFTKKVTHKTICKKGEVAFYMSGGKAPYTIRFQNQTYHTLDSIVLPELENGYYEISIEDKNACNVNTDFYINHIVKQQMQVTFSQKNFCSGNLNILMLYGYPPYLVKWTEGTEEKQQVFEKTTDNNTYTIARPYLDKNVLYQFEVLDQSGCASAKSQPEQGVSFHPEFNFKGTENCDSIDVEISIPDATFNQFKLITKNSLYQIINTETWSGATYKSKVAHNAYYIFEVTTVDKGCLYSVTKRFSKPELTSFAVVGEGCSGVLDSKGKVALTISNFQTAFHKMIWSDVGEQNLWQRNNLDAGVYTFEISEETGCGVKKTFEITKVDPPILPEIPFLCPEETFYLVPQTTATNDVVRFRIQDQNNTINFVNKGQGIYITNGLPSVYTIYTNNQTTGCYSKKLIVDIENAETVPALSQNEYTFCTIGDQVLLTNSSPNAHWYSAVDSTLIGKGLHVEYTTTRIRDSIYVVLQNDEHTCTSDTATLKLEQSNILQPQIETTWDAVDMKILKPMHSEKQVEGLLTYRWYGDGAFIHEADSLTVQSGQWNSIELTATDANGCVSEKSAAYTIDFSLDIENINHSDLVTVYPNPTTDLLFVKMKKNINNGLLKIKDMSGRDIWQESISEKEIVLSLNGFAAGLYILEIQLDNEQVVHVIVVKK